MKDSDKFTNQIAEAINTIGAKESLNCMLSAVCAIASLSKRDINYDCDAGKVHVKHKVMKKVLRQ